MVAIRLPGNLLLSTLNNSSLSQSVLIGEVLNPLSIRVALLWTCFLILCEYHSTFSWENLLEMVDQFIIFLSSVLLEGHFCETSTQSQSVYHLEVSSTRILFYVMHSLRKNEQASSLLFCCLKMIHVIWDMNSAYLFRSINLKIADSKHAGKSGQKKTNKQT